MFLLVVEQLPNADYLLQQMKQKIDRLMSEDKFQQFLRWVQQKSESVKPLYKPAAIRAFYFDLARTLTRTLVRAVDRDLAADLDLARTLDLAHALDSDLDLDRARTFALGLDLDLDRALTYALDLDRFRAIIRAHFITCAHAINDELKQKLQELCHELPDTSKKKRNQFKQWWKTNGEQWSERLREVTIAHRNIGHNWQFTDEQQQKLNQYHKANKLLVECLNSECYISRSVREEIEATLLLPIASLHA